MKDKKTQTPGTPRDADRSRTRILMEATSLFAADGFDSVSMVQIAEASGLSRGTPNYFFGSKRDLYKAVLAAAFARRDEAARLACRPIHEWAADPTASTLALALRSAVAGYLAFLLDDPDFSRLIQREELGGSGRLDDVPRESSAMSEAFGALRRLAPTQDIGSFDVDDAVLVFVSLVYFPATHGNTFMASLGRDLRSAAPKRDHVELVVDQLLSLIAGP
jgi:AcrR family transcriptional regulator